MKAGMLAAELGIGLAAGFVGTLAITASQKVEMRLRARKPSQAPAEAVEKVLDVTPRDEAAKQRLTQVAHFNYGTALGSIRAGLDMAAGVRGPAATAIHAVAVQGAAMAMLPALGVAPPVREWGGKAIAIDSFHHAVYAIAAGLAYDAMRDQIAPAAAPQRLAAPRGGGLPLALASGLGIWGLQRLQQRRRRAHAQRLAEDLTRGGRMATPQERAELTRKAPALRR